MQRSPFRDTLQWWSVPPDQERTYSQYVQQLRDAGTVKPGDYIDFGGVEEIPAEEFFGAAVWQLYKSIDSPFKSVLKLMLMEVYAAEYPNIDLLSLRYKRAVHDGVTTLNELDPYIQMYRKVEEYLMERNDAQRLALVRRCFYLKVNEKLTAKVSSGSTEWRREHMELLAKSWDWTQRELRSLDSKDSWNIDTVMSERRALINALTQSYRRLSEFARKYATQGGISKTDLTLLGRRLYAAFERKAGKIEFVNRGFGANLAEKHITIENHHSTEREHWQLYSGQISAEQAAQSTPMKRGANALEVLVWCYFNRIVAPETIIHVLTHNASLSVREIRQTLKALSSRFPDAGIATSTISELSKNPTIRRVALFVNFGVEALNASFKEGALIASNRTDAFSYGGLHENLARSFDLVIETTWEEIFTFRYTGVHGLFECLCEYLRWLEPDSGSLPEVQVNCFSTGYGPTIEGRVKTLLADVMQAIPVAKSDGKARFIIEIEQQWHVLEYAADIAAHRQFRTETALLQYLGTPTAEFTTSVLDTNTLVHTPLRCIFEANRLHNVQVFLHAHGSRTDIYVLDERGSLFVQNFVQHPLSTLIDHFVRFLHHIASRRRQQEVGDEDDARADAQIFTIVADRSNAFRVRRIKVPRHNPGSYFRLQVIADAGDRGNDLTIFCEDREFSTLEHGDRLFRRVAEHVLGLRANGERYPIYITDIDVSGLSVTDGRSASPPTVQYLVYKRRIEAQLNLALRST